MAGSEELGLREDTLRVLAAFFRRGEAAGSPIPTPPRSPAQEEPTDFLSRLRRCLPCPLGRGAVPPESPRPCSLPLRPCYVSEPGPATPDFYALVAQRLEQLVQEQLRSPPSPGEVHRGPGEGGGWKGWQSSAPSRILFCPPRVTGSPTHREGSPAAEAGGPAGGRGRRHQPEAGLGPRPARKAGPPLRGLLRPPSGAVLLPGEQPSARSRTPLLALPWAPSAFPGAPGPPGPGHGAEPPRGRAGGHPGRTQRGARAQLRALDPGPRGLGGHPGHFTRGLELTPGLRSSSEAATRLDLMSLCSSCALPNLPVPLRVVGWVALPVSAKKKLF
ncbi:bcl-2-like protein 12 isoform X2 [Prionailurus bengalensis]|nr:bcl-2-like protein 12 isoform X2 [Prionailurus bengalensis]